MNRQPDPVKYPFIPLPEPIDSQDFDDFDAQDEREAWERDEDFGYGRGW